MKKVGNQTFVKETNKKLIVDLLKKTGPISRADIRKFVKLSAPTISTNVERLLKDGLLQKSGRGSSMGGRTANFYDVNYNYGYIISIDLSQSNTFISISNLKPETIDMIDIRLNGKKYEKAYKLLLDTINNLLKKNHLTMEQISVIAIATPGVLKENGKLDYVDDEDWFFEKPLFKDLERDLEKKILVENDVNAAILAENKNGIGDSFSYMGYIRIDKGLGAGFMLEEKILRGKDGIAGEMGVSILLDKNGQKKTLEDIFELEDICEGIAKDIESGQETMIKSLVSNKLENITIEILGKAASVGDEYAIEKIKELAMYLAISVSHVFSILGLEVLVIGGRIKSLGKLFLDEVRESLKSYIPFDITITYSTLNEEVCLVGASYLGTEYFFENFYKNI